MTQVVDSIEITTPVTAVADRPVEQEGLPPRLLGRYGDPSAGPTLICVAALHGNEPSGYLALQRLFERFETEAPALNGCLVGLVGNRRALARRCRYIEQDLNRAWLPAEVERVRNLERYAGSEDVEMAELDEELRRILARTREQTYFLDLHSTSGPGPAFVVFEDTLPNREFALAFPVTLVLGIEEELAGTLSDFLVEQGVTTVGFEAGQHDDPVSVERAEAAVWIALDAVGLLAEERSEVAAAYNRLERERKEVPHVVEVRYRHAVEPGDEFQMDDGYVTFQNIDRGQRLAADRDGTIAAPEGGRILMPLYQEQGEDGFFVVHPVHPAWLKLSSAVRRLRLERALRWLPGVYPHGSDTQTYDVDQHVARWLTLQLFHLLGFRRIARDERWLRMTRRRYDV